MKYLKMFYRKYGLPFLIVPLIVTIIGSGCVWSDWFLQEVMGASLSFLEKTIISSIYLSLFIAYNIRNWYRVHNSVKRANSYHH